MELPSHAYWNCEPGKNAFGSRFGLTAGTILRHSNKLGYFVKSDWSDFILGKYLAGINERKFHEFVTPTSYQDWLTVYFRVSENMYGIKNPLELSIDELQGVYNKRPPWALTFSSKGFNRLIDGTMLAFNNPNRSVYSWSIEREKIYDPFGSLAIAERLLDTSGNLQRLTVIGTLSNDPKSLFVRHEIGFAKKFESYSIQIDPKVRTFNFEKLFRSEKPIFDSAG